MGPFLLTPPNMMTSFSKVLTPTGRIFERNMRTSRGDDIAVSVSLDEAVVIKETICRWKRMLKF